MRNGFLLDNSKLAAVKLTGWQGVCWCAIEIQRPLLFTLVKTKTFCFRYGYKME